MQTVTNMYLMKPANHREIGVLLEKYSSRAPGKHIFKNTLLVQSVSSQNPKALKQQPHFSNS